MLRYSIVLSPLPGLFFDSVRKNKIKSLIAELNIKNTRIENIKIFKNYLQMSLLVDWNAAVGSVIQTIIDNANKDRKLLRSHYLCLNTNVPNLNEIKEYLEGIADYKRTDWLE